MSLSRRLALVFRAKANKMLDRAEDPREDLDYSPAARHRPRRMHERTHPVLGALRGCDRELDELNMLDDRVLDDRMVAAIEAGDKRLTTKRLCALPPTRYSASSVGDLVRR